MLWPRVTVTRGTVLKGSALGSTVLEAGQRLRGALGGGVPTVYRKQ